MYASEKYVKMEIKELSESLSELASDLGGDIRYLHQQFVELSSRLEVLEQQISSIGDRLES